MDAQFRSEHHGNTEIGVIIHEGREYKALGAVVTDTHVTAYLGKDGQLTNWHGDAIGTYRITSRWPIRSYVSSEMCQIYAVVNGRTYTGRGCGEGMVFNGKLVK